MFFAQVLGVYLFLISLSMLVHQQRFKKNLHDFLSNQALLTFSGALSLLFGLVIVVSHNIWVAEWPVLITLYGWFLILQGVVRIFWPDHFARFAKDLASKTAHAVICWAFLIIGLYLIWVGFSEM
jgi:hypothetical protein